MARREAARRRLAGESPRAIARDLGRTRQWVAKWAARYDPHDRSWAEGRSRAPKRVANRTAAGVEAQVLEVRARLEANPWAQVGAPAIAWELEKLGAVVPPRRTIEEILERAGATKRQRPGRRASKGIPYPAPAAKRPGDVAQVDLVGPRHLDGGVRFHALNQIDVASHHAGIEIVEDRGDQRVLRALHALWSRHGVPARIQFDNGGPFVSPTGIGEVVRVCLHQGATPVFIPPREPWRNGTIEHFNDTFEKRFFRTERFTGVEHLAARAGAFERFHNAQHRYSATGGLAPEQTTTASKPRAPRPLTELPAAWPRCGRVEFIRFIRSDHKLRLLGRAIAMPDGSAYQYVTAALDLALPADQHNLLICNDQGELLTAARLPTPGG
ncbi:MAG: DDE-type integrase/transposase/recombinase [Solirubrobacteraceae bacterium]